MQIPEDGEKIVSEYKDAVLKQYDDILSDMRKENGTEINLYRILK